MKKNAVLIHFIGGEELRIGHDDPEFLIGQLMDLNPNWSVQVNDTWIRVGNITYVKEISV
ncbi:hypothetical protein [Paenibacillus sp. Marseille-Q4541]|uniref:hypothetical protein n=1 Tax=Paenibacillus sp. Marseille-Q4541 TaxID=2831522 RepID=UPI001BA684F2|nr:hypothetical protein [Paenibacillus sp. Marseille-Q4541]